MVLTFSMADIASLLTVMALLAIFSIFDLRDHKVRNEIVFSGLIIGCVIALLTGHFIQYPLLHLTALILVTPISFILFRMGSIGGADVKVLFSIAVLSPGIELGDWGQPILEAIIGMGGEMMIMLFGGYLYWISRNKEETPPLIPILFLGYIIVQLFAFV
jgi:hypothetical protein